MFPTRFADGTLLPAGVLATTLSGWPAEEPCEHGPPTGYLLAALSTPDGRADPRVEHTPPRVDYLLLHYPQRATPATRPRFGERAQIANVIRNERSKFHLEAVCAMFTPATTLSLDVAAYGKKKASANLLRLNRNC